MADRSAVPDRQTQSFVGTLSTVWRRPGLTGLEVMWRWAYGIPALLLLWHVARQAFGAATAGSFDPAALGLDRALLNDPVGALTADPTGAAAKLGGAVMALWAQARRPAEWVVPLLLLGWVLVSAWGRALVLRRYDPSLRFQPAAAIALQAIRMAALCLVFAAWFAVLRWDARIAVAGPVVAGQEPNLILYCAILIITSIGLFVAWAAVSWWFGLASLLSMREGLGAGASLRAAGGLRGARGSLLEVNLVLGIVKIALLVLLMVFSATPLPFQSVATPEFLLQWTACVTVVYLLASDLFHVARAVAYLGVLRNLPLQP